MATHYQNQKSKIVIKKEITSVKMIRIKSKKKNNFKLLNLYLINLQTYTNIQLFRIKFPNAKKNRNNPKG